MKTKDIVQQARKGAAMPPLTLPERVLWMTVERIGKSEASGYLGKSAAEERIRRAINTYEIDQRQWELNSMALMEFGRFFKAVELAATAYRKEPTEENGRKLLAAIYEREKAIPCTIKDASASSAAGTAAETR